MLTRVRRRAAGTSLGHALFYEFAWRTLRLVQTLLWRLRCHHADRIPREGACLLVANHESFLDPTMLGMCVRLRPMHPLARAGLFQSRLLGPLIRALYSVPIREDAGDLGAMREVLARLRTGGAVLVFPEGSRTSDGAMHPFKRGVAVLVKRAGCPVVPMAVAGTFEAWARDRKLPRVWGQRCAVMVGEPIAPEELLKDGPEAGLRRLESEVAALRGQLRSKLDASAGRTARRRSGALL